jgi:anti-sigma regulatory factor (Ser/Thr protein kinase)
MPWDEVRAKFEPTTDSVAQARLLMRPLRNELPWDVAERLDLVVSELATNAVLHAATPFEVAVKVVPTVRVEVSDGSAEPPVRRHHDLAGSHGRGLLIVDRCAQRWGVDPLPSGKVVWADVGIFTRTGGADLGGAR